ncbi:TPA: hypothetical protein DDW35_10640 [Candidatus Sumerlaeota bacterium]|nr:hypothetical protein [Candidatus Sumerlaeota bacterium]
MFARRLNRKPNPAELTGEKNGYAIGREIFVESWDAVNTPLGLPGPRQAICTRTFFVPLTEEFPAKSSEVHFYATSLPPHHASPERLAALIRGHWGIEKSVASRERPDVLEDRHWVNNPATAQTFTFLRTLTVGLLHLTVLPGKQRRVYCPEKIEYMQADVQRPIKLVRETIR